MVAVNGPATPRLRRATFAAVAAIAIVLDVCLWGLVSVQEGNVAILFLHAAMLAIALVLVRALDASAEKIFLAALLPRSLFTVLAWYFAYSAERRLYIGTNEDAWLFWNGVTLPYDQVSVSYEDPLFPRLNIFLTDISSGLSAPSYLATMQSILFAGSLLAAFAYMFIRNMYGERVGKTTGYLMALSPIAIAFSTGLMRDELIGMFGFLFLVSLYRILAAKPASGKLAMLLCAVACGFGLAFLRSISLAGFVVVGLLMLFSRTPYQRFTLSKRVRVLVLLTVCALLAFAVWDRFDRFDNVLDFAISVRGGDDLSGRNFLNPEGITTKIAEISPALFLLISPYALMQPMPFYVWDAPVFLGGPPALMDVVIGFGGLFNQIVFGLYVVSIRHWIATRDSFGFRVCFVFTLLTGTLTLIGLGQIRMVMAHVFPFFFAGVAVAVHVVFKGNMRLVAKCTLVWCCSLLALYLGYFAYQELGAAFAALPFAAAAVGIFMVWHLAGRTVSANRFVAAKSLRTAASA